MDDLCEPTARLPAADILEEPTDEPESLGLVVGHGDDGHDLSVCSPEEKYDLDDRAASGDAGWYLVLIRLTFA